MRRLCRTALLCQPHQCTSGWSGWSCARLIVDSGFCLRRHRNRHQERQRPPKRSWVLKQATLVWFVNIQGTAWERTDNRTTFCHTKLMPLPKTTAKFCMFFSQDHTGPPRQSLHSRCDLKCSHINMNDLKVTGHKNFARSEVTDIFTENAVLNPRRLWSLLICFVLFSNREKALISQDQ